MYINSGKFINGETIVNSTSNATHTVSSFNDDPGVEMSSLKIGDWRSNGWSIRLYESILWYILTGTYYYHEILRKTIIAFGTIFNDIHVRKTSDDSGTVSDIKVPLAYAPQQKFLARLEQQAQRINQLQ